MVISFPGPAIYCVTVRRGSNPEAVFASGLFHYEACILRRSATNQGYLDAQVTTQAAIDQASGDQRRGISLETAAGPRDRMLHALRSQSRSSLAKQTYRML